MSRPGLNAASRPFYNTRPVQRVVTVLWVLGAVLLVLNGWLYWRAWTGENVRQDEMVQIEERMEERQAREKSLGSAIDRLRVELLNERALFLNGKLAERTFGWSSLFERLSDVLPNEVRLHQLVPRFTGEDDDDPRNVFTGDRVELLLIGAAKGDDAILELIDALFEHPSFKHPSLQTESKTDRGEIKWTLSAVYLPLVAAVEPFAPVESASETPPEATSEAVEAVALPATVSPDEEGESS